MTKADLVEMIYSKIGISKKDASDILEGVFDIIKEALKNGEKVKISGFGNFSVRNKKTRKGRNPQTGEEIEISARRVLSFKPSQLMKDAMNMTEK